MFQRIQVIGVIGLLFLQGVAWAVEPVAVLTEIRRGLGEVQVKLAGETEWKVAQPLLALRPGDQVRTMEDGRAVLVFVGGRGAQTVSPANSPFTIEAPTRETAPEKLRAVVAGVTGFLLGQSRAPTYKSLSVRGAIPPQILSPRETRLLPGSVTFEWNGPDHLHYSVRVLGPEGLIWEQANLPRQPLLYPETAPPLRVGVRYTWALEAEGQQVQRAQFEILPPSEAATVQASLALLLEPGVLSEYPRNTVVLFRAAFLYHDGLYHDARRELLAGLMADPDEPTLHFLLGKVYNRIGLRALAEKEFKKAEIVSTR